MLHATNHPRYNPLTKKENKTYRCAFNCLTARHCLLMATAEKQSGEAGEGEKERERALTGFPKC